MQNFFVELQWVFHFSMVWLHVIVVRCCCCFRFLPKHSTDLYADMYAVKSLVHNTDYMILFHFQIIQINSCCDFTVSYWTELSQVHLICSSPFGMALTNIIHIQTTITINIHNCIYPFFTYHLYPVLEFSNFPWGAKLPLT